jgi:hypothetical protein
MKTSTVNPFETEFSGWKRKEGRREGRKEHYMKR